MKKNVPGGSAAIDKRVRRHVIGRIRDYFVITAPGFEDTCRQELTALGMGGSTLSTEAGGVTFAGRFVDCQRANLYLRTATRILMRIDAFSATNLRQLQRHTEAVPWELFLPDGTMPSIKASCRRSRLYHTEAVANSIQDVIGRRLAATHTPAASDFTQTVFARLVDDRVTLSLDSSGEPLFKRGMKHGPARAPIRESLAAAILMTAGYDARRPLVDPMCGSGTFSLEAAMMAKQIPPGMLRRFAFEKWPAFHERQWAFLKREAERNALELNQPLIFASDVDADASRELSDVISGNGLSDAVKVAARDLFDCEAGQYGGGPGLVVINPPYGIRIGTAIQAGDLFQRICGHLKEAFGGWDVALIVPDKRFLKAVPFPVRPVPLVHGGVRLMLVAGTIK